MSGMQKKIKGRWVTLTDEQEAQERAQREAVALDRAARLLSWSPADVARILDGVRAQEFEVPTVAEWRAVIGFAAAAIVHLEAIESHGRRAIDALAGAGYTVSEQKRGLFQIEVGGHPIATIDLTGAMHPSIRRHPAVT